VEQDVAGLDRAVDEVLPVCGPELCAELRADAERLRRRQGAVPSQPAAQVADATVRVATG